jgi:hypothetical protein
MSTIDLRGKILSKTFNYNLSLFTEHIKSRKKMKVNLYKLHLIYSMTTNRSEDTFFFFF